MPGATRVVGNDFSPVIASAKASKPLPKQPMRTSTVGFHHSVLTGLAGPILEAVRAGKLKRFFVIGGCDGDEPGRSYYSEYARHTPPESVMLTVGCGKHRIRNEELGTTRAAATTPAAGFWREGRTSRADPWSPGRTTTARPSPRFRAV